MLVGVGAIPYFVPSSKTFADKAALNPLFQACKIAALFVPFACFPPAIRAQDSELTEKSMKGA